MSMEENETFLQFMEGGLHARPSFEMYPIHQGVTVDVYGPLRVDDEGYQSSDYIKFDMDLEDMTELRDFLNDQIDRASEGQG